MAGPAEEARPADAGPVSHRRLRWLRAALAATSVLLAGQAVLGLALPPRGRPAASGEFGLRAALWGTRLAATDAGSSYDALLRENTVPRFRDSYLAAWAARTITGGSPTSTQVLVSADLDFYVTVFRRIAGPADVLAHERMPLAEAEAEALEAGGAVITRDARGRVLVLTPQEAQRREGPE